MQILSGLQIVYQFACYSNNNRRKKTMPQIIFNLFKNRLKKF